MNRRNFLQLGTIGTAGLALGGQMHSASARASGDGVPIEQQSVSRWCYGYLELPELLSSLRKIGLSAIDLVGPKEWDVLRDHGFTCSMAYGRQGEDITTGFIDEDRHDELYSAYAKTIPPLAEYGWTNMICFAGNRRGRYDLDGLRVAAKGLKRLMPIAEEHGIVLQMELFNSKVDHPDYMADSSAWGRTLCDMVGSESFKLLYDIYHMQVQEGNIIDTIRKHHRYFGHYHTAGVPGRHELNEDQELNYPAVMRAIVETGFEGYVAHEFIPTYENKLAGLVEAIRVCS